MPFSVEITDKGFSEAIAKAVTLVMADFTPEMPGLGNELIAEIRAEFAQERDPFGNPWVPLKAITVKHKTDHGSPTPGKILEDSGRLHDSFAFEVTDQGLSVFTDRTFEDGTTAEIHQFGGTHPRKLNFIPAREMLPFSDVLPDDWQRHVDIAFTVGVERIFK